MKQTTRHSAISLFTVNLILSYGWICVLHCQFNVTHPVLRIGQNKLLYIFHSTQPVFTKLFLHYMFRSFDHHEMYSIKTLNTRQSVKFL
jgi:hypothetical protein